MGFGIFFLRWLKRKKKVDRIAILGEAQIPYGVMGLSEAEAAALQPDFDLDSEQRKEDRAFFRGALRQSLSPTYNIDLFGIAIVLYLLGNPLGAFGTMIMLALSGATNVFQQVYTKKQLNKIVKDLRPQANVIREGRLRSIEPSQIVPGDFLVIGEGDVFLVDGKLMGDHSILIENSQTDSLESEQVEAQPGDIVKAGTYSLSRRAIYIAQQPGIDHYGTAPGQKLQLLLGELTPLERLMEIVFRVLFVLVLIFGSILLLDAIMIDANLVSPVYHDAFSTIFSVAPTSLFFILIITYAAGVLRITDRGALVYQATAIETMANARYLCVSKDSLISGFQVNLELAKPSSSQEQLSENLVRRVLGDFFQSIPTLNTTDQKLNQAFPGQPRAMIEVVPLLYELGWHGAVFDEPDLRGTYVLGFPEVLDGYLALDWKEVSEEFEREITKTRRRIGQWLRDRVESIRPKGQTKLESQNETRSTATERPSLPERLMNLLDRLLSPKEDQAFYQQRFQETASETQLVFAYLPEPEPIFDNQQLPKIPNNLIHLTTLNITETIRPEAENSIKALIETGIEVKITSSDSAQDTLATAIDLDLPLDDFPICSGEELANLNDSEFREKVEETNIIASLSPSQKSAVVNSLRSKNEGIVMVGNNVGDAPAMLQADLRVALKNSHQAALKLTDIVMLKDTLSALPHVLITGQRLVHGILDVFKLYLSHTIAQLILIVFLFFLGMQNYPMHPTQSGVISAFAIVIPNIFLSMWAAEGRITRSVIRHQLASFIIPAAFTTAILAWAVYTFFVYQSDDKYAQVAVTFALLMAGWLRVLFVQPPSPFWVAASPLRGDRRVYWVVLGSILLFAVIISIPLFSELLRTHWLRTPLDYVWIMLAVVIWGLITRAIWRSNWWKKLVNKI